MYTLQAAEQFCSNPGYGKPFLGFHHKAKHAPPQFSQAHLGKTAIMQYSSLEASLFGPQPTSEKMRKGGFSGLESKLC
jgi:hypothetical protein